MFFEGRGSKNIGKTNVLEKPPFFETSVKPRFQKKGRSMGGGTIYIYILIANAPLLGFNHGCRIRNKSLLVPLLGSLVAPSARQVQVDYNEFLRHIFPDEYVEYMQEPKVEH